MQCVIISKGFFKEKPRKKLRLKNKGIVYRKDIFVVLLIVEEILQPRTQ